MGPDEKPNSYPYKITSQNDNRCLLWFFLEYNICLSNNLQYLTIVKQQFAEVPEQLFLLNEGTTAPLINLTVFATVLMKVL